MSRVTETIEACGIACKYNGWMPAKPPQTDYYAAVFEEIEDIGGDFEVMARRYSPTIELYDNGGSAAEKKRDELSNALSAANVKHRRYQPHYLYDQKKFLTVYDCEDYIEKWSE